MIRFGDIVRNNYGKATVTVHAGGLIVSKQTRVAVYTAD